MQYNIDNLCYLVHERKWLAHHSGTKKIEFCVILQVLRNVSLKDIKSTQRQPDLKVGTVCPLSSKM